MTGAATPLAPLDERTVRSVLDAQADLRSDARSVFDDGRSLTYGEFRAAVRRRASALWNLDHTAGRRIALMLDNHVDMAVTCMAVSYAPLVQVPINVAYRGDVLAHQLIDSGADTIVLEAAYLDRIEAIADRLPALKTVVVRGGADHHATLAVVPLDELDGAVDDPGPAPRTWDPIAIMYTSGTTGQAKGVVVAHAHAYTYGAPALLSCPVESDVALVVLPLFHVGGQWAGLYNGLTAGSSVYVAGGFSGSTFWTDARRHGCTYVLLVGAMANYLYQQPAGDGDRDHAFRRMFIAPVVSDADAFAERFGVEIVTGYGSTEAGTVFVAGAGHARQKACGWPREGIDVYVADEHDRPVADGTVGEVLVRSREPWTTLIEYHNQPEATVKAMRNGWYHTGDAMFVDSDGQFVFVDRLGDAIRRRGENIASADVEQAINSHPAILESAVVGVASELEHDVLAACVLQPGESLEPAVLLEYLVTELPHFMVPRYLAFVDELERTPSGKVRKRPLRDAGPGGAWDREAAGMHVGKSGLQRADRRVAT